MLWVLKNVNDGDVFYLTGKNQFLVGRKECDILIQNDQSISRKHAILRLKENKVTVEDCGSKYNTLHKGKKLTPNREVELTEGDNIQFGVTNSLYSLQKYEFVTTGTRLSSSVKSQLIKDISDVNGKYVQQWTSECTHLTVEEITLTVKFLHALIDQKPVVKPTYWTKYSERVKKSLPPPNIELYNKPSVAEALLNKVDLKPNLNRKTLYKGKQFIFPKEEDKKQLEDIIKKAGGTSISWEKNPMPLEDIKASPKDFLIIQTSDSIDDPSLNRVIKEFSKQGKRTIPIQEIATSIVLCSCEKDCNPNFNRVEEVFPVSGPREPTQSKELVANTESEYFSLKTYKIEECEGNLVIPDTFENKLEVLESYDVPNANSKRIDKEKDNSSQSVKRLCTDKLEETPSKKTKVHNKNKTVNVKPEKSDHFLCKIITPEKRLDGEGISGKENENKTNTKINPFAFLNKNKRSKTGIESSAGSSNPFKVMKKQISDTPQVSQDNPFKLSVGSKKRGNEYVAELSICKKKKYESVRDRIFSSTRITDTSARSRPSRITSKNVDNSMWMSKNTSEVTADITENIKHQFDIQMQHFIEQFKNTVVVEVMKKMPLNPNKLRVDVKLPETKANFKIFKKVKPLRPQNMIIEKAHFTAHGPKDTTGIADSRRQFHNSDNEAEETLKSKKKMPKKFLI